LLYVCVCDSLYLPIVARQRLGKSPFIVIRQLLGKNPPIVARQRLGRYVTAVTNTHTAVGRVVFNVALVVSRKVLPRASCFKVTKVG
jgi:hypothetical protein